jgi:nucleoside-diphosphate-sugar epimerase
MAETGVHVVFGAGQIGPLLAERLAAAGKSVRVVRKSSARVMVAGAEVVRGDAMDPAFCAEAARGAEVVYHCLNTPYFARVWRETLPRLQENLVAAAGRAGARLVVLDNLYALGRTGGRPMDEATPSNPCSKKGAIRAELHEALQAAVRRGDVRAAVGRASDFYGPNAGNSMMGERLLQQLLAGKPAQLLIDPDVPHTYHYSHDVAAGLLELGLDPGADGLWMLPCAPAVPSGALVRLLAAALGRRDVKITRVPSVLLSAMGLVVPILRELREMAYQFEEPFAVDDARFRARFGHAGTPLEEGARGTASWARVAFEGANARGSSHGR